MGHIRHMYMSDDTDGHARKINQIWMDGQKVPSFMFEQAGFQPSNIRKENLVTVAFNGPSDNYGMEIKFTPDPFHRSLRDYRLG